MSRTLGQIIAVGAAVGVTALGGGFLAPYLYSAGVAAGTAVTISNAIVLSVQAYGLAAGASLVGLGPNIPKPEQASTPLKVSSRPAAEWFA